MDYNRFQLNYNEQQPPRQRYGSYGEEEAGAKGLELKYKVAEGLELSIPVQQIGQAAAGALFNAAKIKVSEGFRDMVGEDNYDPSAR
jgi:hypothetical protein